MIGPSPDVVAICETGAQAYPPAPYSPSSAYPEFQGADLADSPNPIYQGVRELFASIGLDAARYGTAQWNPLGEVIRPGGRVLIKPNLVRHYHPAGLDTASIVTHASVLRAVCDYALLAAGPEGEVVIADAPLQSCDFEQVTKRAGIDKLIDYYQSRGINVSLRDLRLAVAMERPSVYGKVLVRAANAGDPLGYTKVDLGAASAHAARGVDTRRYRVSAYDPTRMAEHHGGGKHEYVIANTLLASDTVINVPKLKTHQKAGITCALKNFVGINGHKDCLPHHTKGTPETGGDEYRKHTWAKRADSWLFDVAEQTEWPLAKKAAAAGHKLLEAVHQREDFWAGAWYGNETIARTTIDLVRIARFGRLDGTVADQPQRRIFTVVDGVIAGDEDGPLAPTPRATGVLLAGADPVAVDMAAARLAGFRYRAIPVIRLALDGVQEFRLAGFGEAALRCVSGTPRWNRLNLVVGADSLGFRPHPGWKGHVEL